MEGPHVHGGLHTWELLGPCVFVGGWGWVSQNCPAQREPERSWLREQDPQGLLGAVSCALSKTPALRPSGSFFQVTVTPVPVLK